MTTAIITKTFKRQGKAISCSSQRLPAGKQIDMGLELVELAGPLGPTIASAIASKKRDGEAKIEETLAMRDISQVAGLLRLRGGHKWLCRLFAEAKLVRAEQEFTEDLFDLFFSGKGGVIEALEIAWWLLAENFADFFDLLPSEEGAEGKTPDTAP